MKNDNDLVETSMKLSRKFTQMTQMTQNDTLQEKLRKQNVIAGVF
jgi:hypothetical protein